MPCMRANLRLKPECSLVQSLGGCGRSLDQLLSAHNSLINRTEQGISPFSGDNPAD